MRALVQRVAWAEVEADDRIAGRIEEGLLVYVGIGLGDTADKADWLAKKITDLRIFEDEAEKLNRSVHDVHGSVMVVSNFTLLADARKGRRPAFSAAASAEQAKPLHEAFLDALDRRGVRVQTGLFGAKMTVRSQATGPVNVIVDSPNGNEQT
ncbi:MAG: D-aminoacyl-tRNA deacylase [Planctomycetota bacterium]|nr:D-aminoacyl-tRNA deacylase [Planctomycetota bacterium]